MIKLFSYILRFGSKDSRKRFANQEFCTEEKLKTENFLWKLTQKKNYPDEFEKLTTKQKLAENSKILCYNPEMDKEIHVIRSNTRLQFSNLDFETKKAIHCAITLYQCLKN